MQHNVVVLYHQRVVAPERCGEFDGLWSVNFKRIQLVNQRQLQPEHTAAPGYGRQRQAVPQRVGQTLHDGQAQAQAFAPVALRALFWAPVDTVLMTAMVAIGAVSLVRWHGERDAAAHIGAAVLPLLYLGLPIGAMIAIREMWGREALLLLMVTVAVSDTAQYYAGRRFGRRPLAPAISPKKTIEGALGGFVAGAFVMIALGAAWLTIAPWWLRGLLGMTLVSLGIAGDLFESMLKRSAGMKDSSTLIPGHGGVLDRIDALLFAAPIYYVVLKNL